MTKIKTLIYPTCMKQINFYFFMAAVFALCSCGKVSLDELMEETHEGYTVNFNVANLQISAFDDYSASEAKSRAVVDAKELGTVLNLAVFKSGVKVDNDNQSVEDADFGKVSSVLSEGSYKVVVVVHSGQGNATITSPEEIKFPDNKMTDTFSACLDIEVKGDMSVDMTVIRRVAMYRLKIEEDIPAEVTKIKFFYTGGSSTLDATTGFGCVNSRQTEYRDVTSHVKGQTFDLYTFTHETTDVLKMTISSLNSTDDVVNESEFENVPVEVNKITNHNCSLYSSSEKSDGAHFLVRGDNEWGGEISFGE